MGDFRRAWETCRENHQETADKIKGEFENIKKDLNVVRDQENETFQNQKERVKDEVNDVYLYNAFDFCFKKYFIRSTRR